MGHGTYNHGHKTKSSSTSSSNASLKIVPGGNKFQLSSRRILMDDLTMNPEPNSSSDDPLSSSPIILRGRGHRKHAQASPKQTKATAGFVQTTTPRTKEELIEITLKFLSNIPLTLEDLKNPKREVTPGMATQVKEIKKEKAPTPVKHAWRVHAVIKGQTRQTSMLMPYGRGIIMLTTLTGSPLCISSVSGVIQQVPGISLEEPNQQQHFMLGDRRWLEQQSQILRSNTLNASNKASYKHLLRGHRPLNNSEEEDTMEGGSLLSYTLSNTSIPGHHHRLSYPCCYAFVHGSSLLHKVSRLPLHYPNQHYDPLFLDDPELRTGKHRTVMALPGFLGSILPWTEPAELKRELNAQFHQAHPGLPPDLQLTHIRSIKERLVMACCMACPSVLRAQIEPTTVAKAIAHFERLALAGEVDKTNRCLVAGCCMLLAYKADRERTRNDMANRDEDDRIIEDSSILVMLLESLCKHLSPHEESRRGRALGQRSKPILQPSDLLAWEWPTFVKLHFSLHLEPRVYLPHLQRILQTVKHGITHGIPSSSILNTDPTFFMQMIKDLIGARMYSVWLRSLKGQRSSWMKLTQTGILIDDQDRESGDEAGKDGYCA